MTAIRLVLDKLWRGTSPNGDDIVVLLLLLAMLVSTVHFVTMLITRWGDRYIAMKSLAASLLVHCVCLLGLEVFDPLQLRFVRTATEEFSPVEVTTQVLIQSDDSIALQHAGNTPVPDQPGRPEMDSERIPLPGRQMEPVNDPQRQPENLASLQTQLPDVSEFAQGERTEFSFPVDHGREGPREVAAHDPGSEIETLHEPNPAEIYAVEKVRTAQKPGELRRQNDSVEQRSAAGRSDRLDTTAISEDASVKVMSVDSPEAIEVQIAEPDETVRRRASPVPGAEPVETVGVDIGTRPQQRVTARSFEPRLPRPERTRPSRAETLRPTRLTSILPRAPIPLSSEYNEVRVGLMAPAPSEALRSAAELMELSENRIRRRDSQPAAYRLRSREYRREAVWTFGGTERSEATVERSLRWLASVQSSDGHWDASEFDAGLVEFDEVHNVNRDFSGRDADTGITALVTLSFLGAGYTHEDGHYAIPVDRALDWLIRQQAGNGDLAGSARKYARMYCHGIATYALAEALGMQKELLMGPLIDSELLAPGPVAATANSAAFMAVAGIPPRVSGLTLSATASALADLQAMKFRRVDDLHLRSALVKAMRFTIQQQDPKSGGWRYRTHQEGDVSMFGWQMMSLKSAEIAGLTIPTPVCDRMDFFLNSVRQGKHGGLFGYWRPLKDKDDVPVTPVMTAEALFCQQMLGYPRDSDSSRESVDYLLRHLPRLSELNHYYWYYGTLAMYQFGGKPWEKWNGAVRDALISEQITEGPVAGSWDPKGPWGRYGGRLYSTALATLTLEVYYRLLPLYQMNDHEPDSQSPGSRWAP